MSNNFGLKSQVIIDLFASPVAIIPISVGLTTALFSWAFGSENSLGFYGIITSLIGLGIGGTRFFLFKDEIINKAFENLDKAKEKEKQNQLNELDSRLVKDKDPRTQSALREIRALYSLFHEQVRLKIIEADSKTQNNIEELFTECVSYLDQTLIFYETIKSLKSKKSKKPIKDAREKLIVDVQQAIDRLAHIIDGLREISVEADTSQMQRIGEELEESLKISKKVSEELGKLDKNDYSWLKEKVKSRK